MSTLREKRKKERRALRRRKTADWTVVLILCAIAVCCGGYLIYCKETLRMSKKEKSEKNRKKLRNPENMGFSTFLFLKIDILGVAKK